MAGGQFNPSDSAIVAANGRATVTVKTTRNQVWMISQVSIEMQSAPLGSACVLRKNGRAITPLVATMDAAGGDPPVQLLPQDVLTVEWTGCTPGDVGNTLIFYTVQEYPS